MGQEALEQLARLPFNPGTYVISVTDTDAPPVRLAHAPAGILRLSFDDVYPKDHELYDGAFDDEDGEDYAEFLSALKPMTDEQASRIALFIGRNLETIDTLVCQCGLGQSRSAGIAAAVSEFFDGDGERFFKSARYAPHAVVYRKTLDALRRAIPR